ncbi:MAG: 50S ribosomal protein L11 methyltransferase [Clostridia bacterium]|nr:50S ribosomal protein L11 methyltransferase [Clostridia bacterium]
MNNEWIKLTLRGKKEDEEPLCAMMSMVANGLMIEDYSDITTDGLYGALIDEAILNADKTHIAVSVFLPAEQSPAESIAFLKERLEASAIEADITTEGMKEEDWAEAWKQYYHPIPLGRVTVVPAWEEYTPKENEAVIRMDPGMAFGTGTHETTRLVMMVMQEALQGGERVLDIGTGSGILSLCASKLGASFCLACDIDPVAVKVAKENVAADGADNIVCVVSDLLSNVDTSEGKYDFVLANIVADVILRLLPDLHTCLTPHAKAIFSGIIGERAEEVQRALLQHGWVIEKTETERDWCAILAHLA